MGVELDDGSVVSRDAEHSTYALKVLTPEEEVWPRSGDAVEQTLGAPTAAAGTTTAKRSTAKSES